MKVPTVYHRNNRGFTIVELLIVIVVIGILAAIVIVAYNGVTTRARNNSRAAELQSWAKLFEAYRATNGNLPTIANGTYCLGTGFPQGPNSGGIPRCRDYNGTGATAYPESTGTALLATLATVGRIPSSQKIPVKSTVGPYLDYTNGWGASIIGWFDGSASDCPKPTVYYWDDGSGLLGCYITVLE